MKYPNFEPNTIWTGDNLPIMRGMNSKSIDLIYLDPPFNSNANYAAPIGSEAAGAEFKDTWGLNDISLAWHGEIKHEYPGLYDLLSATRKIHGDSMMAYLIYMSIRIMEMKRILKETGSIYLHCDDAAGHYLKLLMDAVFGHSFFVNEIIWKRVSSSAKGSQHKSRTLGRDADYILHYAISKNYYNNAGTIPISNEELQEKFPLIDENGRRYNTDTPLFSAPSMGSRPNLCYTYKGVTNPHPSGWRISIEKLKELDKQGAIIWRDGKRPMRKKFADEYEGKPLGCIWSDINNITGGIEYCGYPTQKPVKLLARIIEASSKVDDIVLDPFCGCATTLIAATKLNRKWVGIDISEKAIDLIDLRMYKEMSLITKDKIVRRDIPKRTDFGKIPRYNSPENKDQLYGEQGGYCNGCKNHFQKRHLTIDHIIPQVSGGTDHYSNLQLLCGNCNSMKGTKSHDHLIACLTDKGWISRINR